MTPRFSWLLRRLAALLVGIALGAAITTSPSASLVVIPFMALSIGLIVLLGRHDSTTSCG